MLTDEQVRHEYISLVCEIQNRCFEAGRMYHIGNSDEWWIKGDELEEAMLSLAHKRNDAEKKGVPFV